jgi:TPR repeat protein
MAFWNFGRKRGADRLAEAQRAVDEAQWHAADKLLVALVKEGFEPATSGYLLAQCRYGQGRPEEALAAALSASAAGSSAAMFMVHQMYRAGDGTEPSEAESMRYCFAAADAGSARAAYNVAVFSVTGAHGFQRDHREAVRWYQRSMELGNAQAAFNLGMLFIEGATEIRDRDNAVAAFHRSAELGFPTAETLLAHSINQEDEEILSFLIATALAFDPSMAARLGVPEP